MSWNLTNALGPVTVGGAGQPLGSAFAVRPTLTESETKSFHVTVPQGATRLEAAISSPSEAAADMDIYIYRGDVLVALSIHGDSEESVALNNPVPGNYRIDVNAFEARSGSPAINYRDALFTNALGSVAVQSGPVTLSNGASKSAAGTVTALTPPPAVRGDAGQVQHRSHSWPRRREHR